MENNEQQEQKKKKYIVSEAELLSYRVPFAFQDSCVKEYVNYHKCMRQNPRIIENALVHSLPILKKWSKCLGVKDTFQKCQDYREREIFEEMRKLYVENTRIGKNN